MAEKTKVTLVQNAAGKVVAVRVNGSEPIKVMHAGPVIGPGKTNCAITLEDVSFAYEAAEEPTSA